MPQSVWRCRHLDSLVLAYAFNICGPEVGAAQCTSLRQLRFDGCSFDDNTFPAPLCSSLCQLGSLEIFGDREIATSVCLPPEFSQLRCAGLGGSGRTVGGLFEEYRAACALLKRVGLP